MTVLLCTSVFAALGLWLGWTVHGTSGRAALTTVAGAVGGFGIGGAALHVISLRRRQQTAT